MVLDHLTQPGSDERKDLYRIFVYDCPPLAKKTQYPKSGRAIDFSETPNAVFLSRFHQELTCLRKVVLRLGRLQDSSGWRLQQGALQAMLAGHLEFEALIDSHFEYDAMRKSVDMKMGLDIASVAYKQQADQIVLVAGDADFIPAAKLARREGIDFILDPMWAPIPHNLNEHIDGLRSTCPRPRRLTMEERAARRKQWRQAQEVTEKQEALPPTVTDAATDTPDAEKITRLFK
jgi:uncharacterized LabA/DUF88 family protein